MIAIKGTQRKMKRIVVRKGVMKRNLHRKLKCDEYYGRRNRMISSPFKKHISNYQFLL